ncbi:hypothetical protein Pan216_02940 [Planctomycetes bacterium Pan216]|uniref:Uncharacterized protein n=1 Tax=Kolteria novifilia TaxID=2527975 RepID=A0A518AXK8_9BACT|nr:hypothetical protein Pan216_02940 [Planctomycetes bacterium Pan216]
MSSVSGAAGSEALQQINQLYAVLQESVTKQTEHTKTLSKISVEQSIQAQKQASFEDAYHALNTVA